MLNDSKQRKAENPPLTKLSEGTFVFLPPQND